MFDRNYEERSLLPKNNFIFLTPMLTVIFLFLKNLALNYMKYESMGHNKKGKEKKNNYFKACDATIERRWYYIVNRLE